MHYTDGQPITYEESKLASEELDNKRSETFSADERKVCNFSQNFGSRLSTKSILAFPDSQHSKFLNPSCTKIFGTDTLNVYKGGGGRRKFEPTPHDLENGRLYNLPIWQAIRTIYRR